MLDWYNAKRPKPGMTLRITNGLSSIKLWKGSLGRYARGHTVDVRVSWTARAQGSCRRSAGAGPPRVNTTGENPNPASRSSARTDSVRSTPAKRTGKCCQEGGAVTVKDQLFIALLFVSEGWRPVEARGRTMRLYDISGTSCSTVHSSNTNIACRGR